MTHNRNQNLREKYLDGEKLFRKYIEMGDERSVYLLTEWAKIEGMKSSKGDEPTFMGIWKAMWRWASLKENRETAWKLAQNQNFGTSKHRFQYNLDRWNKEMIQVRIPSAWQHATQAKYQKFLRENGWVLE
jgi:hypothetical protein